MTVEELAQEQLEELRDAYFHQLIDGGDEEVLDGIDRAEDIPMGNVKEHYEGIDFVEEDFFCSIRDIVGDCQVCDCHLTGLIEDSPEIRECDACGSEWEQTSGTITMDSREL